MARRALVTLMTDFGLADPYVAATKGMILRHCPQADIVDISHDIPPHQVSIGAFVLANSAPYFPPGTLHVVVVDPGVGTDRAILIGQFGGQIFLFPDNGVITLIKETLPLEGLVSARNFGFLSGGDVSATFHGRDLFGPLAGQILNGADITKFGPTPARYKLLDLPQPHQREENLVGRAVYVDRFGNLVSNITRQAVRQRHKQLDSLRVYCNGQLVGAIAETYGLVEPSRPLALFNSMGLLELAINQGRFCDVFNAATGAEIELREEKFLDA